MNIYTVEEKEAQIALAVAHTLETTHGWHGVKVVIAPDEKPDVAPGKRAVRVRIEPPSDAGYGFIDDRHVYAVDEADALTSQIVDFIGDREDDLADDVMAEPAPKATPPAAKPPARKRKPAPKKATPKGGKS